VAIYIDEIKEDGYSTYCLGDRVKPEEGYLKEYLGSVVVVPLGFTPDTIMKRYRHVDLLHHSQ
jgi:hypothetical protein